MSVLEFVAALKWPITVIVLAGFSTYAINRSSPGARQSFGDFFKDRNFRLKVGGQEIEATLAEAERRMSVAAAGDETLAASTVAVDEEGRQYRQPVAQEVDALRREAVEAVMRSAAKWGWEMSEAGYKLMPNPVVRWTSNGIPEIGLRVNEGSPMDQYARRIAAENASARLNERYEKIQNDYMNDFANEGTDDD